MELNQAIKLIRHPEIQSAEKKNWADLGCGTGLFTQALCALLAPGSVIFAVDKNEESLKMVHQPKDVTIQKVCADFVKDELKLANLNGIMMANSLHLVRDKIAFIEKMKSALIDDGFFLIVEYDTEIPNLYVPFPLSFHSLQTALGKCGFNSVEKIREMPSRYRRANIYSALVKM
ncbi:MAG: class I SAM-dependent methyltransferase [Chitinophagales bacterium]